MTQNEPTSHNGNTPLEFNGWNDYPFGFADYDSTFVDTACLSAPGLFVNESDPLGIEILDVYRKYFRQIFIRGLRLNCTQAPIARRSLESLQQPTMLRTTFCTQCNHTLESCRAHVYPLHLWIVSDEHRSIWQENRHLPLGVTEELMRKILVCHGITPDFLEYLLAYREKELPSDEGQGHAIVQSSSNRKHGKIASEHAEAGSDKSLEEACYLLKYAEQSGRPWGDPWSIRRTGVYHQIRVGLFEVVILLHPVAESKARERIRALFSGQGAGFPRAHPLHLHLLLLSTYITNWRAYLGDLGRSFVPMVSKASQRIFPYYYGGN